MTRVKHSNYTCSKCGTKYIHQKFLSKHYTFENGEVKKPKSKIRKCPKCGSTSIEPGNG